VGSVDARPAVLDRVERAAAFSLNHERWHQRYWGNACWASPVIRAAMSSIGARRARRLCPQPDAILQLTGAFDLIDRGGPRPRLRCSYQGGNFAKWLTRPDLVLVRDARPIRQTLAYEARVQRSMDVVFTFSDWIGRSMVEDYGVDPDRIAVVGAGPNFERLPDPVERDFSRPRLLFVGRNFERKGGRQLLDAFRLVRARRPDVELWIVGPRTPLAGGQEGVREWGRLDRGTPEGAAELERVYREATTFVMPSLYEPFGIVWLEAMAHGLPCVGTDTCAMPEIIAPETGYVSPVGDASALAERLLRIIDDPDRAHAMGNAARRRVAEHYLWDHVAARMVAEVERRLSGQ
jgi:alpha-maltose-1-phosphate synthase